MSAPPVDHLVWACPDLVEGVRQVEGLLGVRAIEGGRHVGLGTRNRLIGLGPRSYLEIVGPDPDQPDPPQPRWFGIDRIGRAGLVTWCSPAAALSDVARRAREVGLELGAVTPASRRRPDGTELVWTFTDPRAARLDGIVPFFIDWGASEHPAATLPADCSLVALVARHPEPAAVGAALHALGVDLPVESAGEPRLTARIDTPSGVVELG